MHRRLELLSKVLEVLQQEPTIKNQNMFSNVIQSSEMQKLLVINSTFISFLKILPVDKHQSCQH